MLKHQGLIDDEITAAIDKQYDAMLREYRESAFGSKESRPVLDARVIYYHLKQLGRIATDSFEKLNDKPRAAHAAAGGGAPSGHAVDLTSSGPVRYRVSGILPRRGQNTVEAEYEAWKRGSWAQHVKQRAAAVRVQSVVRGIKARERSSNKLAAKEGASGSSYVRLQA